MSSSRVAPAFGLRLGSQKSGSASTVAKSLGKSTKVDGKNTSMVSSSVRLPSSKPIVVQRSVAVVPLRFLSCGAKGLCMQFQLQDGRVLTTDERTTFNRGTIDAQNVRNIFYAGDVYYAHVFSSPDGPLIANFYTIDRAHVAITSKTRMYVAHARIVQRTVDGSCLLFSERFDAAIHVNASVFAAAVTKSAGGDPIETRIEQTVLVRFMMSDAHAGCRFTAVCVELITSVLSAPGIIFEVQQALGDEDDYRVYILLKDNYQDEYTLEYAPCNYLVAAARCVEAPMPANDWYGRMCTLDMCHAEPESDVGHKLPKMEMDGAGEQLYVFHQVVGLPWLAVSVAVDGKAKRTHKFSSGGITPADKRVPGEVREPMTVAGVREKYASMPPRHSSLAATCVAMMDAMDERDVQEHPDPMKFVLAELDGVIAARNGRHCFD